MPLRFLPSSLLKGNEVIAAAVVMVKCFNFNSFFNNTVTVIQSTLKLFFGLSGGCTPLNFTTTKTTKVYFLCIRGSREKSETLSVPFCCCCWWCFCLQQKYLCLCSKRRCRRRGPSTPCQCLNFSLDKELALPSKAKGENGAAYCLWLNSRCFLIIFSANDKRHWDPSQLEYRWQNVRRNP